MMRNPELQRHLWLELSTHRLIGMPVVLGLVFLLSYSGDPSSLPWTALGAFGLLAILWGTHLASDSILEEFRHATWDAQRRSSLDPWSLTWGRLAGAPIYAWYGGAISLATFVVAANLLGFPHPVLPIAICALGVAVCGHGAGSIAALTANRNGRQTRSPLLVALVLLVLISVATPQIALLTDGGRIRWFDFALSRLWFVVASTLMFAAWSVIGVWRMMAREMQERTLPSAWLGFAAWSSLYLAGLLAGGADRMSLPLALASTVFLVSLSMSVAVVWFEPRDFVAWRRTLLRWQSGERLRFMQEIPCWLASLPVALLAAVALAFLVDGDISRGIGSRGWAFALCVWLFAARDIALLHFFGFGERPARAVTATLVYLLVLYAILPGLFGSLGLDAAARLLLPDPIKQPLAALSASLLNAAIGSGLVIWRWRQRLQP